MGEARFLNRIVRATDDGWEYECDQRHVEIILEQLELKDAKPLGTPGVEDGTSTGEEADEQPLQGEMASLYRASSARANYVAQDRSDIQYAVKELCRRMSAPTVGDLKKLKRLGRYLVGKPRAVALFPWQAGMSVQDVYTDANWAGCKDSRKSTSGGAIMLGSHVVRTWSKTQNTVAQSSAESELLAIVKAATEALGMISLAADLGIGLTARIHIDASAALGILERRGVGRVRHLDVGALWLQEQALRRVVEFMKVKGTANPADLMTKHLARELVEQYTDALNIECRDDRASTAVKLHSTQQTRRPPDSDTRQTGLPTYDDDPSGKDRTVYRNGLHAEGHIREPDDDDDHDGCSTTLTAQGADPALAAQGADPLLYPHSCHNPDDSYCSRSTLQSPRRTPHCEGPLRWLRSVLPVTSSASGALSQAREGFRCARLGPVGGGQAGPSSHRSGYGNNRFIRSSSNDKARRSARGGGWQVVRPGLAIGRFKGARALRSPCDFGIDWERVLYREVRDAHSGEVLDSLYPKQDRITADRANLLLGEVADIEVEVHYDDNCIEPPVLCKTVRWADLDENGDDGDGKSRTPPKEKACSTTASRWTRGSLRSLRSSRWDDYGPPVAHDVSALAAVEGIGNDSQQEAGQLPAERRCKETSAEDALLRQSTHATNEINSLRATDTHCQSPIDHHCVSCQSSLPFNDPPNSCRLHSSSRLSSHASIDQFECQLQTTSLFVDSCARLSGSSRLHSNWP